MIKEEPKIMTTRATGRWSAPMQVAGSMGKSGFIIDEPPYVGGTDKGASPMEYVTAALVGCAGVTLSIAARETGFQFASAEFEAEGDIDLRGFMGMPGICRHFCNFRGTFTIETAESDERLQQVRDIVENRCRCSTCSTTRECRSR